MVTVEKIDFMLPWRAGVELPRSDTPWDDDWSAQDDDLLLSLKCNKRLSWQYVARKIQRPLSQIQARWTDLLDLQRTATS